jgi:hypothetical protein
MCSYGRQGKNQASSHTKCVSTIMLHCSKQRLFSLTHLPWQLYRAMMRPVAAALAQGVAVACEPTSDAVRALTKVHRSNSFLTT